MKILFYKSIIVVLIIFLFVQGKSIYESNKVNKGIDTNSSTQSQKQNINSEVVNKNSAPLSTLYGLLYSDNNTITVVNVSIDESSNTAEAEINFMTDIDIVEKFIEKIKGVNAKVVIRKYTEAENGLKKMYILFPLKI